MCIRLSEFQTSHAHENVLVWTLELPDKEERDFCPNMSVCVLFRATFNGTDKGKGKKLGQNSLILSSSVIVTDK